MQVTAEILKKFSPLDALSNDSIASFSNGLTIETLQAGRTLFSIGEQEGCLYFLVSGTIELIDEGGKSEQINHADAKASHSLCPDVPRDRTAISITDIEFLRVDKGQLDIHLTWNQSASYVVTEISHETSSDNDDWMTKLLSSHIFYQIPAANIHKFFKVVEPISAKAGATVITQGDPGDYYYLIKSGQAEVLRQTSAQTPPIKLAEIGSGDGFGEEALVSATPRNATIKMKTDGELVRLSKQNFDELIKEPTIKMLTMLEAEEHISHGAIWLDVRLAAEFENSHIENSINLPFFLMRMKINNLDQEKEYICVCDTGRRSSAAAYLLSEAGLNAYVLKDGLHKQNQ